MTYKWLISHRKNGQCFDCIMHTFTSSNSLTQAFIINWISLENTFDIVFSPSAKPFHRKYHSTLAGDLRILDNSTRIESNWVNTGQEAASSTDMWLLHLRGGDSRPKSEHPPSHSLTASIKFFLPICWYNNRFCQMLMCCCTCWRFCVTMQCILYFEHRNLIWTHPPFSLLPWNHRPSSPPYYGLYYRAMYHMWSWEPELRSLRRDGTSSFKM